MTAARLRLLRLLSAGGATAVTALVLLHVLGTVVPLLSAVATGRLINDLSGAGPVAASAVAVVGLLFVDQTVWLVRDLVAGLVVTRVDGRLRATVRALTAGGLSLDVLESTGFGDRAARTVDNGRGLGRRRSPGAAAAGQLAVIFRMAGALGATVLLASYFPLLAVLLLAVSLVARMIVRRQWVGLIDTLDADLLGQRRLFHLSELAVSDAAKETRLYGLGHWLAMRFRAVGHATYGPAWRQLWTVLRRQWITLILVTGAAAAALAVPGRAALGGSLDAGQLVTCVLAAWAIFRITAMGPEAYDIEYGLRGSEAAAELVRAYGRKSGQLTAVPDRPPVVKFEDVVFRYPGEPRAVLDGLTLTLHPGETVAVVGENGAGKTTFVKLLGGLYRPTSGRITVDGTDLAELDVARWRRRLSVLFQDFVHYPMNLRDNVALAAPEFSGGDDAVREALERAGAGELLAGLPDGLDTSLWQRGAGGQDLSGGQWQRVALARTLYAATAGRRVLVLDEPTAHLDIRAEAEFHERVVQRVDGVTTVLISHRLSTVRPAGRIVLLSGGRVTEDGTHDELLALGGDYARFYTLQASAFGGPR
ncbi:ABC transporter ATP-binding protein [Winogradskya consettensis]|uniref:Multidrug ABC transporter permease n=1 Tax=Winogradskya consettensis TaxID=113560 RepID=A0A919SKU7_9ACTN|nr:ABC transporter ATP-binding protein [Actinoplanes consettensis]GIM73574.1 multidrug ABC transporter permease [Actinoplanes consettensis]